MFIPIQLLKVHLFNHCPTNLAISLLWIRFGAFLIAELFASVISVANARPCRPGLSLSYFSAKKDISLTVGFLTGS